MSTSPSWGSGLATSVSSRISGEPYLRYEFVDGMKDFSPPLEVDLVPVTETVFAASGAGLSFGDDWMPVVFTKLPDGTDCAYIGMRAAPRIA